MVLIKTVIELFDECQIKNAITSLRYMPEKVVFIGFKEVMRKKKINDLKNFFKLRKQKIELDFEFVSRYDYEMIVEKLNNIIDKNEDCCFDLTGGKELVLAAMGEVSTKRNIPMIQFNVRTGNLIRVKNCEEIFENEKKSMSITENVALNGGAVIEKIADVEEWNLTADFKRDVEAMWKINSRDSSAWNRFSKALGSISAMNMMSGNLNIETMITDERTKEDLLNNGIIDALEKKKLISNFSFKNNVLRFRLKNEQVFRCIVKAGNILELYTYMVAREIAEESPGYYDDIKMGVIVDWDGIDSEKMLHLKDTRNEIDIFIMRDLIPIFVSCKNGDVHKEALYELSTVAEKFGGEYARKVLIATFVSHEAGRKRFLLQRARDMHIDVIEGVDIMSKSEFKETLQNRVR